MKMSSWIFCLGIGLSINEVHASARNPFMMPLSECDAILQQLDGLKLQGVIVSNSRGLALMADPQQQPLRMTLGSTLLVGAIVTDISRYRVSVSLAEVCDGAHYHWYLPGGKNDKESHHRTTVMPAVYYQG